MGDRAYKIQMRVEDHLVRWGNFYARRQDLMYEQPETAEKELRDAGKLKFLGFEIDRVRMERIESKVNQIQGLIRNCQYEHNLDKFIHNHLSDMHITLLRYRYVHRKKTGGRYGSVAIAEVTGWPEQFVRRGLFQAEDAVAGYLRLEI